MDGSPRILLVVGGGIAAYKSCELVRLIKKAGGDVTCVLTDGGAQFVTPMSLAALSGNKVYSSLWDLKDEVEMGHIELSREADLVVVCPATADLLAKMAAGIADDLGTTLILATDKPVLAIPAMNVKMWENEATRRNVAKLVEGGVKVMQPDEGEMACGDVGPGRLPEPEMVWLEIADTLDLDPGLAGPVEVAAYLESTAAPVDEEEGEEEEEDHGGGLGGLLASLITRATPRRIKDEEVEYEAEFDPHLAEAAGDALPEELEYVYEEVDAEPDLDNPIFAKKGKAKSAPPTDPEAINHLVRTGAGGQAPEPIEGDDHGVTVDDPAARAAPALAEPVAKTRPEDIVVEELLEDPLAGQPAFETDPEHRPLHGKHVLVTAGPTYEAIDPVRYIANRSSGRQGFAVAAAAAALGARVTLIAGPVHLKTPLGVDRVDVESASEMADAVKKALPADAAIMIAAVSDWRSKDVASEKIKKRGSAPPALILQENPDILATLAADTRRPALLIGFAAETENLIDNAKKKRKTKGADWIVANDVSKDVMGGSENTVKLITSKDVDHWDPMPKEQVALKLMEKVADALK
ncbi:MAG TPA: bifunctional phosphopantothenoylcysteine decarboxylase/phosphopantothenate synthase [Sphingomonadaceae bacterium]|nr:bifunctional phosphopantothenoylcysteine decarboxylase/phosphopantothenate synthase [Sphingomonadaceae bacterium]